MASKEILNFSFSDGRCALGTSSYFVYDGDHGFADIWRRATTQGLLKFTVATTAKDWTVIIGPHPFKRTTTVQTAPSSFSRINVTENAVNIRFSPDGSLTEIGQLGAEWAKQCLTRPLPQLHGSLMTVENPTGCQTWQMPGNKLPPEAIDYLTSWFNGPVKEKEPAKKRKRETASMTREELIEYCKVSFGPREDVKLKEGIVAKDAQIAALKEEKAMLEKELGETKTRLAQECEYIEKILKIAKESRSKKAKKEKPKPDKQENKPIEQTELSLDPLPVEPKSQNFDSLYQGVETDPLGLENQ